MKKILVVDDDEGIVDSLEEILEEEGYQVDSTVRGEEALPKVLTFRPDLVVLDVLISGTDGRDVCRQLKQTPNTKDIPVVMISARTDTRPSALKAGAADFISKPFDVDDLLRSIQKRLD